jgi:hypothetical protein
METNRGSGWLLLSLSGGIHWLLQMVLCVEWLLLGLSDTESDSLLRVISCIVFAADSDIRQIDTETMTLLTLHPLARRAPSV